MQSNPNALSYFTPNSKYSDPDFSWCDFRDYKCYKTLALRIYNSTYVLGYGAGLYSFFENYDVACIKTNNCQDNIVFLEQSEGIYLYALNTLASQSMVTVDHTGVVPVTQNADGFCQGVILFEYP